MTLHHGVREESSLKIFCCSVLEERSFVRAFFFGLLKKAACLDRPPLRVSSLTEKFRKREQHEDVHLC